MFVYILFLYIPSVIFANPTITPFSVYNLHEDTQVETELAIVQCQDTTAADQQCSSCNIVTSQPVNGPFKCWKKYSNADFRVYYVGGQSNSDLKYSSVSSYFLTIQCNATDGSTATDVMEVDIQPNLPPKIQDFPSVSMNIDAKSINGDVDDLVYQLTVTDNETDPITYIMYTEPTVDYFQMSTDGKITNAKDLKSAVEPVVAIKVNVSDGTNTVGPHTITVTLTNLNERPYFTNLPTNITLYETVGSGQTLMTLSFTDLDIYSSLTPVCTTDPSTEAYKFIYVQTSQQLRLATVATGENILDAETTTYYNISCLINDGYLDSIGGYINLYVLNVNEPPVFNEPLYYCTMYESEVYGQSCDLGISLTDPENDPIPGVFLLTGNNSERFRYDEDTRRLHFNTEYDIDNSGYPTSTLITIAAIDSWSSTGTSNIQVNILDENDNTPTFANSVTSFLVTEGRALGTLGTIAATDADLTSPNNQITYSLIGGSASSTTYATVLGNGQVRYANTFDTSLHGTSYFMYVEAKDGGTPARSSTGTVVVSYVTTTSTTSTSTTTSTTTTTTASTTTTAAPGYFDDPSNVALFTVFMILIISGLLVGGYFLYRYCTTGNCCGQSKPKPKQVQPYDKYGNRRDREPLYDDDDPYGFYRPASINSVRLGNVNGRRALPSPRPGFL